MATGGKDALIAFYRLARRSRKLVSILGSKKTVLAFFLDKDIDEIVRTKCRSRHVFYTAFYDVENHVFKHADFIRGLSSAASIDTVELREHPTFQGNWCESAAQRWREWVVLCLLRVKYAVPGPNYRCTSRVNKPLNGPLDTSLYDAEITRLETHLGFTRAEMNQRIEIISKVVDRHISRGTFDILFKGKWYATLLELDFRAAFSGRAFNITGIAARVTAALASTLDFSQPWVDHFVLPLEDLFDQAFR
jgi:hypothetical protein